MLVHHCKTIQLSNIQEETPSQIPQRRPGRHGRLRKKSSIPKPVKQETKKEDDIVAKIHSVLESRPSSDESSLSSSSFKVLPPIDPDKTDEPLIQEVHSNKVSVEETLVNTELTGVEEGEQQLVEELATLCRQQNILSCGPLERLLVARAPAGSTVLGREEAAACLGLAVPRLPPRLLSRWLALSRCPAPRHTHSIHKLVAILGRATNHAPGPAPSAETWVTMLDLYTALPAARVDQSRVESYLRAKVADSNIDGRVTLQQNQSNIVYPHPAADVCVWSQNLGQLRAALLAHPAQRGGFLPPSVLVQLTLAYSTVLHTGLDKGAIRAAVNASRAHTLNMGLVSVEEFLENIAE